MVEMINAVGSLEDISAADAKVLASLLALIIQQVPQIPCSDDSKSHTVSPALIHKVGNLYMIDYMPAKPTQCYDTSNSTRKSNDEIKKMFLMGGGGGRKIC